MIDSVGKVCYTLPPLLFLRLYCSLQAHNPLGHAIMLSPLSFFPSVSAEISSYPLHTSPLSFHLRIFPMSARHCLHLCFIFYCCCCCSYVLSLSLSLFASLCSPAICASPLFTDVVLGQRLL